MVTKVNGALSSKTRSMSCIRPKMSTRGTTKVQRRYVNLPRSMMAATPRELSKAYENLQAFFKPNDYVT
jgi:hypothetical protein